MVEAIKTEAEKKKQKLKENYIRWYAKNKKEFNTARRERYKADPAYRKRQGGYAKATAERNKNHLTKLQ